MNIGRLVIGGVIWASMVLAQEPIVHVMTKGETLADLAERHLGGREHVVELQNLNGLPNSLVAKPGFMVVIPGAARAAAIAEIERTATALEFAVAAGAKEYALDELTGAREAYGEAQAQLRLAAYEKSRLQAILAQARATSAKLAADARAPVQEAAKLTAVHGLVRISADGASWVVAKAGDELPVAHLLETGADGRCEVLLADGSVLQARPNSRLTIEVFKRDRRDGRRDSRLRVLMGDVLGKVKKRQNKKSNFQINSSRTNVAIRGTEVRIGGEAAGRTRVSLLEGQVDVAAEDQIVDVAENFGTFVEPGQVPVAPLPLLPPPAVTRPPGKQHKSGLQEHVFVWRKVVDKRFGNFRLELARDALFNQVVQESLQRATQYETGVLAPGRYHWRIATVDDKGLEGQPIVGMLEVVRDLRLRFVPEDEPLRNDGKWIFGNANTVEIATVLAESSVDRLEYSLNKGPFVDALERIFFQKEGEFEVRARGVGADGEVGPVIQQIVEIDQTPPVLQITIVPAGDKRQVTVTATDKNGVAGIRYRIAGEAFVEYAAPFEVSPDERIEFRAEDRVGNVRSTQRVAK